MKASKCDPTGKPPRPKRPGPRAALCALAAVAGLGGPAPAQVMAGQPATDPSTTATALSGVTVAASKRAILSELTVSPEAKCLGPKLPADRGIPRPRIVSSFPAPGAVVRPGILVLRITFDMPMSCDGIFQEDPPWRKPCPGSVQRLALSYDRRTIRMACLVDGNTRYGLRMNATPSFRFVSLAGWPSPPYELTFSTSSQAEVTTLEEAQAQDTQMPPAAPAAQQ
jgi:hypothetical protein